ncbi:hypothetical protein [Bacillus phage YungSlug]|nr:hypothetical protein [Bacillus phage YungSlug]
MMSKQDELKAIGKVTGKGIEALNEVDLKEGTATISNEDAKLEVKSKKQERFEQRQKEKAEQKKKAEMNRMVSYGEALMIASRVGDGIFARVTEAYSEPVRLLLIENLALKDMLIEKGLLQNEEEYMNYIEEAGKKLLQVGEKDEQGKEDGTTKEETQE